MHAPRPDRARRTHLSADMVMLLRGVEVRGVLEAQLLLLGAKARQQEQTINRRRMTKRGPLVIYLCDFVKEVGREGAIVSSVIASHSHMRKPFNQGAPPAARSTRPHASDQPIDFDRPAPGLPWPWPRT